MGKLLPAYEDESEIPEGLADYYVESGGKFVLQVEGISSIDSVQTTLKKERDRAKAAEVKAKEAEGKLEKLGDDPDEVQKKLDEYDDLKARVESGEGGKGADEETIARRVEAKTRSYQREIEKLTKERDEAAQTAEATSKQLRDRRVEEKVLDAAKQAGATRPGAEEIIRDKVKLGYFDEDDEGNIVTTDNSNTIAGIDPKTWFGEQKDGSIGQFLWPDAQGAGAKGNNGNGGGGASNPFDAKSRSVSEMNRISRESPEKAKRLASLAGYDSPEEAAAAAGREAAKAR